MSKTAQDAAQYAERTRVQCLEWAAGNPYHNRIDDECCPDFSCCEKHLFNTDIQDRWRIYHKKYGRRQ